VALGPWPTLFRKTIFIPYFGLNVIIGLIATRCPAANSARQRCARVASSSIPSVHANWSPMHMRVPPPKGKYENFGRAACASGVHRSGSNRSGSGNHRASRWVTSGLTTTSVPRGITTPATS
jgi:hypothetical protein